VTLRRDGFVSLDAGESPAALLTRPLAWPGGTLHLNADATGGEIRVEVVNAAGNVLAQSQPVRGDQLRAAVALSGGMLAIGADVRLRITAHKAKLYSYWFEKR
jgi:hypothetical protein